MPRHIAVQFSPQYGELKSTVWSLIHKQKCVGMVRRRIDNSARGQAEMSKHDFTKEEFASRRAGREAIDQAGLDWLLVIHPVSMR